jgi:hypothetical protein
MTRKAVAPSASGQSCDGERKRSNHILGVLQISRGSQRFSGWFFIPAGSAYTRDTANQVCRMHHHNNPGCEKDNWCARIRWWVCS